MSKDKTKGGLGKGLDVLFGGNVSGDQTEHNITELNPENKPDVNKPGERILFLPIESIKTNPYQPRKDFNNSDLNDLAESIRQKGVIQAITVRKLNNGSFELITGERRLRASKLAGIDVIPAFVIDVSSKEDLLEIALIENIQRSDLNAIEVAEGYKRLIDECKLTQEIVADKVGKSRSAVANTLRLLTLPEEIKLSIQSAEISEGHARSILALESDVEKLLLWKKIISDSLSVRKAEEFIKSKKRGNKSVKNKKIYEITEQNKTAVKFLEEKFMEHFGTRVKLHPTSPDSGNIIIEYYTAEDLERIVDLCRK